MITKSSFPIFEDDNNLSTRDTIHSYARLLGAIRAKMTPEQKDYWHISLSTGPQGFRTGPIHYEDGSVFELSMNLISNSIQISTSTGHSRNIPLNGQSIVEFSDQVLSILETMGIKPDIDLEKFSDKSKLEYNPADASRIFKSYSLIDIIFKTFKGTISFETSPVQLWPHHMDIAFTCYPHIKESIEQIAFGYLTGDETVEEPYFYITAYPELEDISKIKLLEHAHWNAEGWQGVVLKYKDLIQTDNPGELLINHLQNTFDQLIKKA